VSILSRSRAWSVVRHGDLTALDDVLGAAHGVGRAHGEHAAGDEPVEAHADGGVLLVGRLGDRRLQRVAILHQRPSQQSLDGVTSERP
jgi:hypothetical protein